MKKSEYEIHDPIKNRKGHEYVIIKETKPNGEVYEEMRLKVQYIAEQAIQEPIFQDQFVESVDGNVKNYDLNNLRIRDRLPDDPPSDIEVRDVVGYEDFFKISEIGTLIGKRTDSVLTGTMNQRGYVCHCTRFDGRGSTSKLFRLHRCVAEAFIPNPENKPEVNHLDGVKDNNSKENLDWATPKENSQHAWENGLSQPRHGEKSSSSKISDELRLKIAEDYKTLSGKETAEKYNVSKSVVIKSKIFADRLEEGDRFYYQGQRMI